MPATAPTPPGDRQIAQVAEIYEAFAYFIKVMQARGDLGPHQENGVTGAQSRTLQALQAGPHTMGDLSASLYVHRSTASGMIDRLVAKGLVERERLAEDRRRVRVRLTAAGEAFVRQAPPSVVQMALDKLHEVPPEELAELHGALQRMQSLFTEAAADTTGAPRGKGDKT